MRRNWNTVVCFSCGKTGHVASRCPNLNEVFPFMLPGWWPEKVGGNYTIISPGRGRSRADPGGGGGTPTDPGYGVNHPDQ